jgi:hypothetical protein
MSLQYRGLGRFAKTDEAAHRAVIEATDTASGGQSIAATQTPIGTSSTVRGRVAAHVDVVDVEPSSASNGASSCSVSRAGPGVKVISGWAGVVLSCAVACPPRGHLPNLAMRVRFPSHAPRVLLVDRRLLSIVDVRT